VRTLKRFDDRGQSLAEFALSIPLLFAVIYGVCDFGRALYTYDLVTGAARIGSRYAIVHGSSCSLSGCPASAATIQSYVQSKVSGVDSSQLTVSTTWSKGANSGCTDALYQGPQCIVKVTVSYPFQFLLSFNRTLTLTSSSQMVISQ